MDGKNVMGFVIIITTIIFIIASIWAGATITDTFLADAEPYNGTHIEYPKAPIDTTNIAATCTGYIEDCLAKK